MKLLALFIAIVGALLLFGESNAQVISCQVDTRQTFANGHTVRVAVPVDLWFCIGTPTPLPITLTRTPTITPTFTQIPATSTPTVTHTSVPTPVPAPTAPPSGNILVVPDEYSTIAEAVEAASDFDTIQVNTGIYFEQVALTKTGLTLNGIGYVVIDGQCLNDYGVIFGAEDVTVQNVVVRNVQITTAAMGPARGSLLYNRLENYNCANRVDAHSGFAGVSSWYGGPNQRVIGNSIEVRPGGDPHTGGNGIWFKSNSTDVASGGGHQIIGNTINGGNDGIGGENEDDPHGSFDKDTVISFNRVSNCWDDGIQSEGGNYNIRITDNIITECGLGIAFAPTQIGPLYVERNIIISSTPGYYLTLACFKVGNWSSTTAKVYLTDNTCTIGNGGDGIKQTNAGIYSFVSRGNKYNVGRYVYEFTSVPPDSSFDNDCMYTTDPTRFVKWGSTYTSLSAFRFATGQEPNGVMGPCVIPTPVPANTPTVTPTLAPTFTPTFTSTATSTPEGGIVVTYLHDTFTAANGTDVAGRAMDSGQSWIQQNSQMTIQSNKAVTGGYGLNVADSGQSTVRITLDIDVPNANNYALGALFRVSDGSNRWAVRIQRDGGGTASLRIIDTQGGSEVTRATANFVSPPHGTTVTITVTATGTSITASASTGESTNFTSSFNQTATYHGIEIYTDGTYVGGSLDNFLVTDIPSAANVPEIQNSYRQRRVNY